jgi:hypothetical protein
LRAKPPISREISYRNFAQATESKTNRIVPRGTIGVEQLAWNSAREARAGPLCWPIGGAFGAESLIA